MSQIFPKSANAFARLSIAGVVVLAGVLGGAGWEIGRSGFVTGQGITVPQPVPFSHDHHVSGLGIDCRYCHTAVETSSSAGIPPSATCYNCHKLIWKDAPMLEPVRASWRTGQSLEWVRVHNLPDFVYFNHSIHIRKGVGCETCHGRLDQMPGIWQVNTLQMEWCLGCHRAPENYVRPREAVFTMGYKPSERQSELGARLVKEYKIDGPRRLTSCSTCHR